MYIYTYTYMYTLKIITSLQNPGPFSHEYIKLPLEKLGHLVTNLKHDWGQNLPWWWLRIPDSGTCRGAYSYFMCKGWMVYLRLENLSDVSSRGDKKKSQVNLGLDEWGLNWCKAMEWLKPLVQNQNEWTRAILRQYGELCRPQLLQFSPILQIWSKFLQLNSWALGCDRKKRF